MSRPDYTDLANGSSSWDATANDNYAILRNSIPLPEYVDLATLSSARPPAQNEGCLAAVTSPSWIAHFCDGSAWLPLATGASATVPLHLGAGNVLSGAVGVSGLGGLLAPGAGSYATLNARRGSPGSVGTTEIQLELNGVLQPGVIQWTPADGAFALKTLALAPLVVSAGDRVSFIINSSEVDAEDLLLVVI